MKVIPVIPETAPFSIEQRTWLNGFMAGLFSYADLPSVNQVQTNADIPSLVPLTILYGSQTGTAESLAKQAAKLASTQQFVPAVYDMAAYKIDNLKNEKNLLIIASTYGDGEPPDNALNFWETLKSQSAPIAGQLNYSVMAIGDTKYDKFCKFGKDCDTQFSTLGGRRIYDFAEADVDYEETFQKWLRGALYALGNLHKSAASQTGILINSGEPLSEFIFDTKKFDKKKPYGAQVLKNQLLTGTGSLKETRHFEISLDDDDLSYEPGDALAVMPKNNPTLVNETLAALKIDASTKIEIAGKEVSAKDAFSTYFDLRTIKKDLFKMITSRTGNKKLHLLLKEDPMQKDKLNHYLRERELVDIFTEHFEENFQINELAPLLNVLQPRLYSISSSWKTHPRQAHLTIAVVRYETLGRLREGTCSSYLAERYGAEPLPVYIHSNTAFRLPINRDTPIIMVGPGTGVAPFRAFLQDRRISGATGSNVLFFGEQHATSDFFYREEFEKMVNDGYLKMYTAFSRDQDQKIYVQHRILENRVLVYNLLEKGAHFYVCGDAERMAKDVDAALLKVIESVGKKSGDEAKEYVQKLRSAKRYQRDVY